MTLSRVPSRLTMPSRIAFARNSCSPAITCTRRLASGSEPPRSQSKPAQAGEMKTWMPIAGIGVGLGAVFFYLMTKPNNAPKVAHATGQNLPELTERDTVSEKDGRRMGTHRTN